MFVDRIDGSVQLSDGGLRTLQSFFEDMFPDSRARERLPEGLPMVMAIRSLLLSWIPTCTLTCAFEPFPSSIPLNSVT